MPEIARRPWHVAFHYLGCAVQTPEGVRVPSLQAPVIEALADASDRLTVVAYDPPDEPVDTEEHLVDHLATSDGGRIDHFSLGPIGTWRDARARKRRNAERIRTTSPDWDVLIVWLMNRRIAVVTRPNRSPRLVTIDGSCVADEARAERIPLPRKLVQMAVASVEERLGRETIRASGLVVVNSQMLADRHRPENGNIVVRRWTRRRSEAVFSVPDRLTDPRPNFLVAGRLSPYKGVLEAMDAFARIRAELLPGAVLHVAGEGESRPDLERKAGELGLGDAVVFHGWLAGTDLFDLYRRSDVLLHLSYAESFPRVVLEAMAHSVPVVCTPVGGLRDLLADEREVLFVPPEGVDPAVAAVERLITDPPLRRGLIERAFETARESAVDAFVSVVTDDIARRWPDLPGIHAARPPT